VAGALNTAFHFFLPKKQVILIYWLPEDLWSQLGVLKIKVFTLSQSVAIPHCHEYSLENFLLIDISRNEMSLLSLMILLPSVMGFHLNCLECSYLDPIRPSRWELLQLRSNRPSAKVCIPYYPIYLNLDLSCRNSKEYWPHHPKLPHEALKVRKR